MANRTIVSLLSAMLVFAYACHTSSAIPCPIEGFHCASPATFQLCVDGGEVEVTQYQCNPGTVCNSACKLPCQDSNDACTQVVLPTLPPALDNKCSKFQHVCVSDTTYHVCASDNTQYPGELSCNSVVATQVCDMACAGYCRSNTSVCDPLPAASLLALCPAATGPAGLKEIVGNVNNYVLCINTDAASTAFVAKEFACPVGSTFNKAAPVLSAPPGTPYCIAADLDAPTECSEEGRLPNVKDCSTYYDCTAIGSPPDKRNCPIDSFFSGFRCLTAAEGGTSTSCKPPPPVLVRSYRRMLGPFGCTEVGRFADPDSCGHYFLCSSSGDGLVQARNECPGESLFDPATSRCDFEYKCPVVSVQKREAGSQRKMVPRLFDSISL